MLSGFEYDHDKIVRWYTRHIKQRRAVLFGTLPDDDEITMGAILLIIASTLPWMIWVVCYYFIERRKQR